MARPCTWNGIEYSSIAEAARSQNPPITVGAMCQRLKQGYTCDDDLSHRRESVPVTIDGVKYKSLHEAEEQTGYSNSYIAARKHGEKPRRNLTQRVSPEEFIAAWNSAIDTRAVADALEITIAAASSYAYELRQMGYEVKKFPPGSKSGQQQQ